MRIFLSALVATVLLAGAGWADEAENKGKWWKNNPVAVDEMVERTEDLITRNLVPMAKRNSSWRCRFKDTFMCDAKGCEKGVKSPSGPMWVDIDFNKNIYSRCDQQGCTHHTMKYLSGGLFTVIQASSGMLKSYNDGQSFVDIATLGVGAFLNYGSCAPSS